MAEEHDYIVIIDGTLMTSQSFDTEISIFNWDSF